MEIKSFTTPEEVNSFTKTVRLDRIEAFDDKYVVYYRPYMTKEEAATLTIKNKLQEEIILLAEEEIRLAILEAQQETAKDPEKLQTGIDNSKRHILNHQSALEALNK